MNLMTMLVDGAVVGGGLYLFTRWKQNRAVTPGYSPPERWAFLRYPPDLSHTEIMGREASSISSIGGSPTYKHQASPDKINLVSVKLREQRGSLPPFILHYRPHDLDEKSNTSDEWIAVQDGNPSLGEAGPGLPHYVQTLKQGMRPMLQLWRISDDDARNLNRGPRGVRTLPAKDPLTNQAASLKVICGTRGGVHLAPVSLQTDAHGTAEPAGLGNMDPALDPHGSAQAGGLKDMHLS